MELLHAVVNVIHSSAEKTEMETAQLELNLSPYRFFKKKLNQNFLIILYYFLYLRRSQTYRLHDVS